MSELTDRLLAVADEQETDEQEIVIRAAALRIAELEAAFQESVARNVKHHKRIMELEDAIKQHRENVWGQLVPVGHHEDVRLYAVLQEDKPHE
jgi:hypothetical protein